MAVDPFAQLQSQFQGRGYDPLAVAAGLGMGRQKAAETALERERRQQEAQQQAAELQLRARQLEQSAAAEAARRQYEMQQLGMTQKQQEAAAAAEARRLDQAQQEASANAAYRQAALAQAPELARQQQLATAAEGERTRAAAAELARLNREAAASELAARTAASGQERLWSVLGTLGAAGRLSPALAEKVGKGIQPTVGDILGSMAGPTRLSPELILNKVTAPVQQMIPLLDSSGQPVVDPITGAPQFKTLTIDPTPEQIANRVAQLRAFGIEVPYTAPVSTGTAAPKGALAQVIDMLGAPAAPARRPAAPAAPIRKAPPGQTLIQALAQSEAQKLADQEIARLLGTARQLGR